MHSYNMLSVRCKMLIRYGAKVTIVLELYFNANVSFVIFSFLFSQISYTHAFCVARGAWCLMDGGWCLVLERVSNWHVVRANCTIS